MTITKLSNVVYKVKADDGKVFVSKDRDMVYDDIMYCPNSEPDVEEVTSAEAEELRKEIEKNARMQEKANA